MTIDLRTLLHNPLNDPALRELTGLDPQVRDYVLATPGSREIIAGSVSLIMVLLTTASGPEPVQIAFGCAGGRHRSVVLANELTTALVDVGIGAEVLHHDISRPVVQAGVGGATWPGRLGSEAPPNKRWPWGPRAGTPRN